MAFEEVSALSEEAELTVVGKGEALHFFLGFYTFCLSSCPAYP